MKRILKTVQKALTNNWLLKILALVIAAIVWLAVININDPTKTVTIYNVPITIVNEEAITDNQQIYSIEGNQRVNVTVSGRRSVVEKINSGSFIAESSLEELSVTNSVPVRVMLKNPDLSSKLTISKQSVTQLLLHIENVETKTYAVESNVVGTVSKNYELDDVELARNNVDITAPESVHNQIAKVAVNVDVGGATSDFTEKCKVVMYDQLGEKISGNDTVKLSRNKIKASVNILKLVKVPIVVEVTGKPAKGYEVVGVSTDPKEITLAGPASLADDISEFKISGVDVTALDKTVEREVNLIDYLTSGMYIRGDAEASLTIVVEGEIEKEFTFKASEIDIKDIPSGCNAEITSTDVKIVVSGKEKDFEDVTSDTFKAAISLKGLQAGKRTAKLNLDLPKGLTLVSDSKVKVTISKKSVE